MNTIKSFFCYQIFFLLLHCISTNVLSMETQIIEYYIPPIVKTNPFSTTHRHQKQQTYTEKIKFEKKLHKAAKNNKKQKIYELINDGVNVNASHHPSFNTALHCACINENEYANIVEILAEKGADPNLRNCKGNTPLHCAAYLGYLETGKILINKYASLNIINKKKETPLHLAVLSFIENKTNEQSIYKSIEFIKLLLNNGANPTLKNNQGNTALHITAWNGNIEMAKIITNVDNYNTINIQNNYGETPLHYATLSLTTSKKNEFSKKEQLTKLIELLLYKGARTTIKDHQNFRPDNQIALIVADTPPNEEDAFSTQEERSFIYRAHALLLCAKLENLALSQTTFPFK